jgi:hypothetical protein
LKVTDRLKRAGFIAAFLLIPHLVLAIPAPPKESDTFALGKTCVSSDPDFLCLGVKYVVYEDSNSQPIVSPKTVESNIASINAIWRQCKIGFQVDEYVKASPAKAGLPAETSDFSDLDRIREAYDENSSFLIVTTYKWNRAGNLGHTPANAWTKMPGSGLYGVVMEQKVGDFPNIIAHELGHYLNLYHANERSDVMNAIIYNSSKEITQEQCSTARAAVNKWWGSMVRRIPAASPNQPELAHEPSTRTKNG